MHRIAALLAEVATFAAAATAEAKRVVRYDVGGDLAGISERLIVARDGSTRQSSSRSGGDYRFKLAKQLRGLRHDLRHARFTR